MNTFIFYFLYTQDPEEFKSKVKDHITDWMRKLRDRNIVDWMIIQVISQDSLRGNKPKIPIPRSSVFDKIKSDFGGKNSDRYLQLLIRILNVYGRILMTQTISGNKKPFELTEV